MPGLVVALIGSGTLRSVLCGGIGVMAAHIDGRGGDRTLRAESEAQQRSSRTPSDARRDECERGEENHYAAKRRWHRRINMRKPLTGKIKYPGSVANHRHADPLSLPTLKAYMCPAGATFESGNLQAYRQAWVRASSSRAMAIWTRRAATLV